MKYGYYPGCSLEHNAASYHTSCMAVARTLGFELMEIEDWNCCGATEYVSLNLIASYTLIARNLAQTTKSDGIRQLVAPCSACYLNLRKCDKYMGENSKLAETVNLALAEAGLSYKPGTVRVRHILDVIVNDIGLEAISAKVAKPLHGLRLAPYYGCMIVRPQFTSKNGNGPAFDSTEYPTSLDDLLVALGAEVVDYPMKAQCCGGHMTQISEGTGFELIRRLVKGAVDRQADMIVALCPMCQVNLDAFQGPMNAHFKTNYKIPVVYFSQVMGIALGLSPAELGFGSELVDARPALEKISSQAITPAAAAERRGPRPKRDDKSLPMPRMEKREVRR